MAALLWFGLGAAAGSAVTRKAGVLKSHLTAKGIAQATAAAVLNIGGNLGGTAREAAAGVKAAQAARAQRSAKSYQQSY